MALDFYFSQIRVIFDILTRLRSVGIDVKLRLTEQVYLFFAGLFLTSFTV